MPKLNSFICILLQPDIPATVRVAQERMLDMMKESLKEKTVQEKELKLVKKYKKVKFFGEDKEAHLGVVLCNIT